MTRGEPGGVISIVERRGQKAVTTSEAIAAGCKVQHKNVLSLIRRYASEFEEFGLVAFETRPRPAGHHGGGDVEIAILNEDQATYLITLLRNTDVVRAFKRRLVKAFRAALDEIAQLYAKPPRTDLIRGKRDASRVLTDSILEWRTDHAKLTDARHYMSEQKLCNWVVTGEFRTADEGSLSNDALELLRRVRERNAALIVAGIDYGERKSRLTQYAIRQRTKLLTAAGGADA